VDAIFLIAPHEQHGLDGSDILDVDEVDLVLHLRAA
jgi:hypothetical protein